MFKGNCHRAARWHDSVIARSVCCDEAISLLRLGLLRYARNDGLGFATHLNLPRIKHRRRFPMNVKIISAILVLALASMACGFSIDLPERQKAGPEVKESIKVTNPKSDETHLTLSFGAGKLTLSPGPDGKNLVDGTAVYNVKELKPEIQKNGDSVEIKQGDFHSLPQFDNLKNEWDLQVSDTPLDLTVHAGAYEGNLELGGLALKSLTVRDGASHVDVSFLEPNQTEMSLFRYETGAVDVKLAGVANANLFTLTF